MPVAFFIYPSGGADPLMPATLDARATEPSRIGLAEKSRSIFSKQRFLGNFSLPFPDKDLGHGSAAASDF
jgi:hypothetical protein